jgi:hypothetical protein
MGKFILRHLKINMRTTLVFLFLFIVGQVDAQTELPQKIRISLGKCNSTCGYSEGFNDIYFKQQLEYSLTDSIFRYRNKIKNKFSKLNKNDSGYFTNPEIYHLLDSLFNTFTKFKTSPGKYYIYRIELIYYTSKIGLPSKTKVMDFLITTNPERIHPKFIDELITEYEDILKNRRLPQ